MTDYRSAPSPAEECLCRPYSSSQKGGTVIDESVTCFEEHERQLRSGGYRPSGCLRCGRGMHIHDYRPRVLRGDARGSTSIAVFRCCDREHCGAVIRVLPALIARCLWRGWHTVEQAVAEMLGEAGPSKVDEPIPARTVRRWRERLLSSAAALVLTLGTASDTLPEAAEAIRVVGMAGTRAELVVAYARHASLLQPTPLARQRLAAVGAIAQRLGPGMRLM
jgi:hypothetical protein